MMRIRTHKLQLFVWYVGGESILFANISLETPANLLDRELSNSSTTTVNSSEGYI